MRMVSKFLFVIAASSLSLSAMAGGTLTKSKITRLAFQSEHLFIYSDSWSNPNGCGKTGAVVLAKDSPNYDKAYTLILAAFMAGREISGYSDGCISWDENTFNTIRGHKYLVVY